MIMARQKSMDAPRSRNISTTTTGTSINTGRIRTKPNINTNEEFQIFPDQPDRDPVHLYRLYADKRPDDMMTEDIPFFLTPGNKTQECWFMKSAIGINKMKTDAGIQEPRITPYRSKPYIRLA
ncbi:hypothetical protein DPMN_014352 [Dreissena polymorpha]|uniref:ZMYM2-like/QRICH1 C-terminal domain-containing protein n=1 Tax=Dreissena polymorpha TaxID=45954 RepID=A0A9D4N9G4_DREPO|nr:hypothetical protein DPMN_014352 [Dreissena polymorpha]